MIVDWERNGHYAVLQLVGATMHKTYELEDGTFKNGTLHHGARYDFAFSSDATNQNATGLISLEVGVWSEADQVYRCFPVNGERPMLDEEPFSYRMNQDQPAFTEQGFLKHTEKRADEWFVH